MGLPSVLGDRHSVPAVPPGSSISNDPGKELLLCLTSTPGLASGHAPHPPFSSSAQNQPWFFPVPDIREPDCTQHCLHVTHKALPQSYESVTWLYAESTMGSPCLGLSLIGSVWPEPWAERQRRNFLPQLPEVLLLEMSGTNQDFLHSISPSCRPSRGYEDSSAGTQSLCFFSMFQL